MSSTDRHAMADTHPVVDGPVSEDCECEYDPGSTGLVTDAVDKEEYLARASRLASLAQLDQDSEMITRGALLAHDPRGFYASDATAEEREVLLREIKQRFHQPYTVWWVSVVGALAATVQGMDETSISGAQLFFLKYFGLEDNATLIGFVNASPYLMCATVGCWLAIPCNHYFGRRGTIFIWSIVSVAASFWLALANTWQVFLGGRLLLGASIGANSATVAVYTAECTPASIRGGLVMFWEVFVAFGILLGYLMGAAFVKVVYPLNWRLMMGSTFLPPLFVILTIFFGPESPRYLVSRGRYAKAYQSLLKLRPSKIQAARDLYCIVEAVNLEDKLRSGRTIVSDIRDIITVPRVRYAALSTWFIMFMQNFCGINAMTYYTAQVFVDTGVSSDTAIYASVGAGALLFICAIPAIKYIDVWGRRTLLLWSLFAMCVLSLFTGFSFLAPSSSLRLPLVAVGIYLWEAAYAPGQGVVPFVYASEAFPLYMRTLGMSFSTATTWLFSFSLTMAWPSMLASMSTTGAFCFYSAWSLIGAVLVFFFVPETCGLSLEELDMVFNVPIGAHGAQKLNQLQYWLGLRSERPKNLYESAKERFSTTATAAEEHETANEYTNGNLPEAHVEKIPSTEAGLVTERKV